jgi:hypothetical protein
MWFKMMQNLEIEFQFKKEDLWIGAYWRYESIYGIFKLWICVIPCFPIFISWEK